MDPREITPRYTVSPQIAPADVDAIKAAGFTTLICNRPDEEVPPPYQAAAIEQAAKAAGLDFVVAPLTHQTMTPERIAEQRRIIAQSEGPVFAYCASGTRSTVVWALGQAGEMPLDQIIKTAAQGGYDLQALAPRLSEIAAQGGIPEA